MQISKLKNRLTKTLISFMLVFSVLFSLNATPVNAACSGSSLLGIPSWYKYLPQDSATSSATGKCVAQFRDFSDTVLVVLAIIEILVRIATYSAIIFFIYGAISMIISQGTPERINSSRSIMTNAAVGLLITLLATGIINFFGRQL